MTNKILIFVVSLFSTLSCFAWGQKGHDVIAFIAQKHLNPGVQEKVEAALGGKSMVYYANWMDDASNTPEYAYGKTWHYKNIDANETYETAAVEERGNVVIALNNIISELSAGGLTPEKEALDLKMLIHLVGDMHQPMHMGRLSDRGGNRHKIKFFNRPTSLHTIWDTDLVESVHKWSYTEWQEQVDRASEEEIKEIVSGTVNDWAKESYEIAKLIYAATPEGFNVYYDYLAAWRPVIEDRFLRGGLRLASVLNSIYTK